ncbi:MAG: hypothetical protein COW63_03345 [Bacteroidetes bacterium CG18_big_fil_WC_8_21_14_2_50_41_14]|nr:MAG: hypothetical protein COW63_03345 [Bacteroidetes bacterium CG18_big_fil_WC_8_21_14_2_50_41_14]
MKVLSSLFSKAFRVLSMIILLVVLVISGCNGPQSSAGKSDENLSPKGIVRYAHGFNILDQGNGTYRLLIFNPETPKEVFFSCTLVPKSNDFKSNNDELTLQVPIDSVAVFSATQLSSMAILNQLDRVVGVSEARYITNPIMKQRIEEGKAVELGNNGAFFVERTLALHPQVIFYSPYQLNEAHPLAASHQIMIPFLDFLETNPLGRAEWIKFTALFFGQLPKADSLFNTMVQSYDSLKKLAASVDYRPTVMSDKYFADQWYVPGGQSYMAMMIADAGGDYIWRDDPHNASIPLNLETVLSKASHADFWRIVGSYEGDPSYEKLGSENEFYSHFDAFKNRKVLFCDSRKTGYFEQGPLQPQVQLADLIHAFHPELLPDYKPVYYKLIP